MTAQEDLCYESGEPKTSVDTVSGCAPDGGQVAKQRLQDLSALHVRELKAKLTQAGVGFAGCVEKGELVIRLLDAEGLVLPLAASTVPQHGDSGEEAACPGDNGLRKKTVELGMLRVAKESVPLQATILEAPTRLSNRSTEAVLWGCATVLSQYLVEVAPWVVQGRRVVELGCGTGLVGIAAYLAGAKEVVLTDMPSALELAKLNVAANTNAEAPGSIRVEPLAWGESVAHLSPPFDVILGSDVVYPCSNAFQALGSALRMLCGPETCLLLAYRRRHSSEEWFFSALAEDFDVQRISVTEDGAQLFQCALRPKLEKL